MKLNPYLAFDGRCRDAFEFYQKTLGGKISFMQTIGESPMASSMPAEAHDRIMHVTLQIGRSGVARSRRASGTIYGGRRILRCRAL